MTTKLKQSGAVLLDIYYSSLKCIQVAGERDYKANRAYRPNNNHTKYVVYIRKSRMKTFPYLKSILIGRVT